MTRQLKLLAFASVFMIFATGQNTTWCGCDLRPIVADIFDGTGCVGGCVGDCGGGCGCDDCGCEECGDCGSCGCDGCVIDKIPGTYSGTTIENVAQVRLTNNAIGFFESMLRPMIGSTLSPFTLFTEERVEQVDLEVASRTIRICRGATAQNQIHCDLEFDITRLDLEVNQAPNPDQLRLLLDVEAWLSHVNNSGQRVAGWPMTLLRAASGWDVLPQESDCVLSYDTRRANPRHIRVELVFPLGTSGIAPRDDINIINVLPLSSGAGTGELSGIDPADDIAQLSGNCQWTVDQINGDLGTAITNSVVLELRDRLPRLVKGLLCEQRSNLMGTNGNMGVCPSPSVARNFTPAIPAFMDPIQGCGASNGNTNLAQSNCLPILLGMEGRLDLGGLLGSLIPGYSAVLDFILAASDEATTPNSGLSVWLKGGVKSLNGHNDCVPVLPPEEVPALPTVPRTRIFEGNVTPGGRPTDVMVGVSEAFVNYAAYQLWDAGALCIQVGSTTIPMLSPSLLGIALGTSLNTLVFPADSKKSPLGLALRPQKPPVVRFEELASPGIRVNAQLPQLAIDFYAWSLDRYVRLVTIELDVTASVDVKVNDGKVGIYLGGIAFENAEAKNASLVSNPASIVNFFGAGIGGIISSVLGSSDAPLFELDLGTIIPSELEIAGNAIPLPMGVELREDAFAVVFVDAAGNTVSSREVGADTFMGIFVDFTSGGAPASGLEGAIQTHVEVTSVYIPEDRTAFQPETLGQGELPRVEIYMSADAPEGVPLEYRYRLALGGWSEWQDSPYAVIESPALALQQEHLIMARARVKGDPRSEDKSSAIAKARIDVTPPLIDLADDGKKVRLQAVDFVSPMSNLQYRYREPGGEFSEWQSFGDASVALLDASQEVEVEVRDEAGNIASNVAELRGLPQAEPGGGCSCTVAGKPTNSGSTLGFLAMLAVLGGTFYRVRRRRSA